MKLEAARASDGEVLTAEEAVKVHRDGDRYRETEPPGRAMRLHKSPAGTMQPHFEYEPRWD